MKRTRRTLACIVAIVVGIVLVPQAPRAQTGGSYQIEVFNRWDTSNIDVLIVPPRHGQVFNGNGVLNGSDPSEATPFNTYLEAIEDSIAEWDKAFAVLAPDWLNVNTNPYVVGRDTIPTSALTDPEIVINSSDNKGFILGVAVRTGTFHCVIDNSMFFVTSFTYEDMFNVSTHEFGHCLGSGHVIGNEPAHDVMFPTYMDSVGAAGNHLHCVSTLDMKAVEVGFGAVFGRPNPASSVSIPVSEYTDTCGESAAGPAPTSSTPPTNDPPPGNEPGSGNSPTPPPPSESPSPTPSPSPSPTDSGHDEPEHEDVFRTVRLRLGRHLVGRGQIITSEDSSACASAIDIAILRRRRGAWRVIETTTTDQAGEFRVRLSDRPGRYRAEIGRLDTDDRSCTGATSPVVRHRHR